MSVCLSVPLFVRLPNGPSICPSVCSPFWVHLLARPSLFPVCLSAFLCPSACPPFFVRQTALLCPSACPPFSLSDCLSVFPLNYPLAHEHKFCSIEHLFFFLRQRASNVSEVSTFRFSPRFSRQMSIVVELFLGLTGHRGRRRSKTVRRQTYERAVCRLWHPS